MIRTRLLRPSVVIPVVVVVVGGAVWIGLRAGRGTAATTTTAVTSQLFTVSPTTLAQTVSATGTIAPAETENLSFAVAGTVTAVKVAAGQSVKQGQVLATVSSAALESAVAASASDLRLRERATLRRSGRGRIVGADHRGPNERRVRVREPCRGGTELEWRDVDLTDRRHGRDRQPDRR